MAPAQAIHMISPSFRTAFPIAPSSMKQKTTICSPIALVLLALLGSCASNVPSAVDSGTTAHLVFVGDTGTGDDTAKAVADQILQAVRTYAVSHVFLLGDNIYESGQKKKFQDNFLDVYKDVLDHGVKIHAALGNHDVFACRVPVSRPLPDDASAYKEQGPSWLSCDVKAHLDLEQFGYVDNKRYYMVEVPNSNEHTIRRSTQLHDGGAGSGSPLAQVFVLDSNTLGSKQKVAGKGDAKQLKWLDRALAAASDTTWKIVMLHHPMYSPRRCERTPKECDRGPDKKLRAQIQKLLTRHGVQVVFQGHQHMYARVEPPGGVLYFVSGAGAKEPYWFDARDPHTVQREDRGKFNHFILLSISRECAEYHVIDKDGTIKDTGSLGNLNSGGASDDRCSVAD